MLNPLTSGTYPWSGTFWKYLDTKALFPDLFDLELFFLESYSIQLQMFLKG